MGANKADTSPVARLPDPEGQRHGRLLQERHEDAAPHRLPGGVAVAVDARHLGSCNQGQA